MANMLNKLSVLEEQSDIKTAYTGPSRWMLPYVDILTLLLGLFVVMCAYLSQQNTQLTQANHKKELLAAQASEAVTMLATEQTSKESHIIEQIRRTPQLNQPGMHLIQNQRGIVLSFDEGLFFLPGQATLSGAAQKTLNELSHLLVGSGQTLRVEGHTDNMPIQTVSYPSNWELSTARATTIVRYLIEAHHLPPEQLSAAGYGEYHPIADNSTIEGKQKNRRVDIVLLHGDTPSE
jgi:chemotaxis protein MotB